MGVALLFTDEGRWRGHPQADKPAKGTRRKRPLLPGAVRVLLKQSADQHQDSVASWLLRGPFGLAGASGIARWSLFANAFRWLAATIISARQNATGDAAK